MFCLKCGTQIPDKSEFCFKCGEKIPSVKDDNVNHNESEDLVSKTISTIPMNTVIKSAFVSTITISESEISYKSGLKNLSIKISDITDISHTAGTLIQNGKLFITANGKQYTVMFFSENNEIIAELCSYFPSPTKDLITFEKVIDNEELIETFGSNKMDAIMHVRAITKCKLSEAKNYVDKVYKTYNVPTTVDTYFSQQAKKKQDIQDLKYQLEVEREANKTTARQRKKINKSQGVACCPKCGSASLSANKKGFGIGKAVIGRSTIGNIGLTAGNIGAKKVLVTCLNCGKQFKPGK